MIDRLWLGYLTYGLGVGVGVACAYVPMVAVVGGWFLRRRNTALGIAVAGIGFGTVFGAPIAATLIAHLGWRATYVAFAIAAHRDSARMRVDRRAAARPRDAVARAPRRRASQSGLRLPVRVVGDSFDRAVRAVRLSAVLRARPRRERVRQRRTGRNHRRRERRGTHGTRQSGRPRRSGAPLPGELSGARAQLRNLAGARVRIR